MEKKTPGTISTKEAEQINEKTLSIPFQTISPTEVQKEPMHYTALLNGTATNQFSSFSTRNKIPQIDKITGSATMEQGTLKVFIDNYTELTGGLRVSTHKLLDTCTIMLTRSNTYRSKSNSINNTVVISIDEYMRICNVPQTKASKDKMRRKLKEDLDTLYHISMEWSEKSGKQQQDFAKMRICSSVGIERGNIILTFSQEMASYLNNAYIMQYPLSLLQVDERNANIYPLGRKILSHYSNANNQKIGTANIIGVKALLAVCPDIPTYEEVMEKGRQVEQRIKTPFEKALNGLSNILTWEYSNAKGLPLTQEQLEDKDFNTFIKLYVKFIIINPTGLHEKET